MAAAGLARCYTCWGATANAPALAQPPCIPSGLPTDLPSLHAPPRPASQDEEEKRKRVEQEEEEKRKREEQEKAEKVGGSRRR